MTITVKPLAPNQTEVHMDGIIIFFSYKTPVACKIGDQYYRTTTKYSVTTSKHVNKWVKAPCEDVDQATFDKLVGE